jgi:peptidoglycan-associated lipoprotein
MSKLMKTVAILAILAALVATACRTKTKPTVTPTASATDTVGTVPPPPPPPTKVEEPTDFVQPTVKAEELPSDINELNRRAQDQGWIRDAFFNYDEAGLSADAQDALSTSAAWLKSHGQYNLLVEGHCDERGTEQYNLALGDKRANTVKEYLSTLGVDSGRIRTVSYGEERPFDAAHNEEAWAKNRRGHLVIVGR